MSYLVVEALLRLIKPTMAIVLGLLLYWIITGVFGEPGSVVLGLACFISAAAFIMLLEEGVI